MTTAPGSDFGKLWAALSVSLVGSEITALAIPLIAAMTLDATPLEMGLLIAAGQLPFLLFSLPAGAWVDRLPRRPVLIAADLGSALLLLTVPIAMAFGGSSVALLCTVVFGVGAMTVISEVAHYAYLPSLVGDRRLIECNSKLQVSHSASSAAGPGLGGLLVQVVSAPLAVLVDAASFVGSAALLAVIRSPEPLALKADRSTPLRHAITDGFRTLLRHRLLRPIVVGGAVLNLFRSAFEALYVLYLTTDLALAPATIGLIFAVGGAGAVPGALVADRAARRWGVGPVIVCGWALAAVGAVLVPLAVGPGLIVVVMLAAASAFGGLAFTVANVHQWSLRQAVTPNHLAGRVTASHRFIVYGAGAVGALLGGLTGAVAGLRPALFMCAVGMLLGPLVAVASPLRHLRQQPIQEGGASE